MNSPYWKNGLNQTSGICSCWCPCTASCQDAPAARRIHRWTTPTLLPKRSSGKSPPGGGTKAGSSAIQSRREMRVPRKWRRPKIMHGHFMKSICCTPYTGNGHTVGGSDPRPCPPSKKSSRTWRNTILPALQAKPLTLKWDGASKTYKGQPNGQKWDAGEQLDHFVPTPWFVCQDQRQHHHRHGVQAFQYHGDSSEKEPVRAA